jgi:hypothetical protein
MPFTVSPGESIEIIVPIKSMTVHKSASRTACDG